MKPKSRGNGQGSAYRRGTKWEACVTIRMVTPDDPAKKPYPLKRRKGGFATKKEALDYCPILLAGGIAPRAHAPRLSEYWDTYQTEYDKLSQSKRMAYKIAWNRLEPLHDAYIDDITIDLLRKTVSSVCNSYYTARDCKSLLANLYKLAAADGFANRDLPSYIVLPELHEKERQPFSEEEQKALWKLFKNGDKRAAIPLLMIYTGMMPGEAMKLRVENIDLDNNVITGAGMKTDVRKKTPIVLSDAIVPVVEDLIANARPNGYIWKQREDEWYEAYYAALEAAGCRKLTPYSCRHTTATALAVTENIAPQTIKRIMRWSTTRMLDRYAHPDTSDALSAVNQLKRTGT